jgi:Lon protease-like protein
MLKSLEKLKDVRQLPIFPLPLILLPNENLPLHIFEPRYRQMLADSLAVNRFFGISFLDEKAIISKPKIGSVGCVAEIKDVEELPDERFNILTAGLTRYRIHDYIEHEKSYLLAEVEFFEDTAESKLAAKGIAKEVFDLFDRIARAAFKLSGDRRKYETVEQNDPEELSFLIMAAFNLDIESKYELIETDLTDDRLLKLREILLAVAPNIEERSEIMRSAQTNGHSKKPIDLN